ncbi:DUF1707 domain-containing protein [Plantactinospora siamensis]|uniref:DUF1707 domain-containing protein n=1 Tax=Plantactinospora siamensis TaxID=555372 RepID=A0ABV6NQ17_9ACTN
MNSRSDMRASDADREAVAEQLRGALNEGRLDLREYDERLQRTYAARTYGDLDGLLTDLPGTVPPQRSQVARPQPPEPPAPAAPEGDAGTRQAATRGWLLATWSSYFSVVGITSAIWLVSCIASGHLHYYWPVWVAGPWGVVLLISTITGLLGGAPQRHWGHQAHRDAWQARNAARYATREARYAARDARRRARGR